MSRLIDADLIQYEPMLLSKGNGMYEDVMVAYKSKIDGLTTIEERKTGKWQWMSSTYDRTPCELRYMCSVCHHETIFHSNEMCEPWEKFCPNCGARMSE